MRLSVDLFIRVFCGGIAKENFEQSVARNVIMRIAWLPLQTPRMVAFRAADWTKRRHAQRMAALQ